MQKKLYTAPTVREARPGFVLLEETITVSQSQGGSGSDLPPGGQYAKDRDRYADAAAGTTQDGWASGLW